MKLDLGRTPVGQSALDVSGQVDLDFGPQGPGPVLVEGELRVDNLEGRCVVRGELTATGPAACDRCLEIFPLRFAAPIEILILRDAGQESDDSDSLVLHQREGIVDLHESVREATVLAVPLARVCRTGCRGLCSQCGADLNQGDCACEDDAVDPRWDGLPD
jgi:uncharacterized protein